MLSLDNAFELEELLARVQALCRRAYGAKQPRLEIGDLEIDTLARTVRRAGQPIDLAMGVFAGVVLSALMFARKIAHAASMDSVLSADGRQRTYAVTGQLFFVTVTGFLEHFDFQEDVDRVVLKAKTEKKTKKAASTMSQPA